MAEGSKDPEFWIGTYLWYDGIIGNIKRKRKLYFSFRLREYRKKLRTADPVPGLAYDTIGYKKTVERIHRLKKKYNAKVLFGHDIDQYRTLKFVPEYYS